MQEKWLYWKKHLKREETYLEPSGTSTTQLFFFFQKWLFSQKSFIADIQLLSKYATEGGLPISCSEN